MKTSLVLRGCVLAIAGGLFLGALGARANAAPERPRLTPEQMTDAARGLKYQTGPVVLSGGLATIAASPDFKYLDPTQSRTVLEKLWGNPPTASDTLGMLVPADFQPLEDECWAVVIRYSDEGYVKDDDAAKIDYNQLLKDMQEGVKQSNATRAAQGYPKMDLLGWATTPRYDAAAKKLYWAKRLQIEGASEQTLNYNIRVLGRRGYLELNAIARMNELATVEKAAPRILGLVDFKAGERYADFNGSTDKVAAYGIAGLIAGGIAAKAGFFKAIWLVLLGAKKLLVAVAVGAVALVGKLFSWLTGGKRRQLADNPDAAPPAT